MHKVNYFYLKNLSPLFGHGKKLGLLFLGLSGLPLMLGNVAAQEAILTLNGHTNSVESMTLSNDGQTVLSASHDNTVKLWNLDTGEEMQTFQGHADLVMAAGFSPDGSTVVSGSADNTIKVWDITTGEATDTFQEELAGWFYSIAFSPTREHALFSSSADNVPNLWNSETGNEIGTFKGHDNWVYSVTFSPDGDQALSASEDGTMKVWDIENREEMQSFAVDHIWAAAFSPDNRQLLTGGDDGTLTLWGVENGNQLDSFQGHTSRVYAVAFSTDGSQAVSGDADGTIKVWNLTQGKAIKTFSAHPDIVSAIAFVPNNDNQVLSASYDNTLKLWDLTATPTDTGETETDETEKVQQPLVQFEISATSGLAPLTLDLDASTSTSTSSEIVSYEWFASHLWDEQITLTASGSTANLTFDQAGEYTLMLIVKDQEGRTSFEVQTIVVGELALVKFKGLNSRYTVGERIVVDFKVNAPVQETVDLWSVVRLPSGQLLYRTPTDNDNEDAIFSAEPQPFKTAVDTSKNHRVMTHPVQKGMEGNYTLYGFYVEQGKNPLEDGLEVLRSNLMFEETTLVNE
jgi:WD40 repeat protein